MHPETPAKGYGLATLGAVAISVIGFVTFLQVFVGLQTIIDLDADASSAALAQLAGIRYVANLVAGALFVTWLWQAWTNAETVFHGGMTMGRGWTIGAWLVPIANIVLPYLSVRGVVRASADHRYIRVTLRVWWVTFAGAQLMVLPGSLLGEVELTLVVAQLLLSVAALSAAVLIYAISDAHDRRQGRKPVSVWSMAGATAAGLVLAGLVGTLGIDLTPTPRDEPLAAVQIRPSAEPTAVSEPSPEKTLGPAVPPETKITLRIPAKVGNRLLVKGSDHRSADEIHYLENPEIRLYSQISAEYGSTAAGNRVWIVAGTSGELTDLEWNMYLGLRTLDMIDIHQFPPGRAGGRVWCVRDWDDVQCAWTREGVVGLVVWYGMQDLSRASKEIYTIRAQVEG